MTDLYLDTTKTFRLLEKYKLPVPKYKIAGSKAKLPEAVKLINTPFVLKLESKKFPFKSEVLSLKMNIANKQAVIQLYDEIAKQSKAKNPKFKPDTFIVQEQKEGFPLFLDFKKDARFGLVLYLRMPQKQALRIFPITIKDFYELIAECLSEQDRKKISQEELYKIVDKTAKLIAENKTITELLLHPVIASKDKAFVIDAKVRENA